MSRRSTSRGMEPTGQHETNQAGDQPASNSTAEALRSLPSVEEARQALAARLRDLGDEAPTPAALVDTARAAISLARAAILAGGAAPTHSEILADALVLLRARARPRLHAVINAAGAILNTNLGRAPL